MNADLTNIQRYITDELSDNAFYTLLANDAPSEDYRQLLMATAADEALHAESLRRHYRMLTGKGYSPLVPAPVLDNSFPEMLRSRVLRETDSYRTYMNEFSQSTTPETKNMFSSFSVDENIHAIRLLYMLSRY